MARSFVTIRLKENIWDIVTCLQFCDKQNETVEDCLNIAKSLDKKQSIHELIWFKTIALGLKTDGDVDCCKVLVQYKLHKLLERINEKTSTSGLVVRFKFFQP